MTPLRGLALLCALLASILPLQHAHAQAVRCEVDQEPLIDFGRPSGLPTSDVRTVGRLTVSCVDMRGQPRSTALVCASIDQPSPRQMIPDFLALLRPLPYEIFRGPGSPQPWVPGSPLAQVVQLDPATARGAAVFDLHAQLRAATVRIVPGAFSDTFTGRVWASANATTCGSPPGNSVAFSGTARATLHGECSIRTVRHMAFPASDLRNSAEATAELELECTRDTLYRVSFNDGLGPLSANGRRQMGGPGGAQVEYELRDGEDNRVLSAGVTIDGQGTGMPEPIFIEGSVPAPSEPKPPGVYTDTVTVTVTY